MAPRFILAKYAPDLARMEPRNIGVIVWRKGELRARFLDANEASFVTDPETYQRWVSFWSRRIEGDAVQPRRGKPVSAATPACIEALISNQKGNYLLVESGELIDTPRKGELQHVVDQLFEDLVSLRAPRASDQAKSLARRCDALLVSAGVEFKKRRAIVCQWRGIELPVHPDYYIGNGHAEAVLQRATLSSERSVHHAAVVVDAILESRKVSREHCRAMIRRSDIENRESEQALRLLKSLCDVIDIDSPDAREQVAGAVPVHAAG